jgi:peroxiredoxin
MKIFSKYAFVVVSIISVSLFISESNLFADSSKEERSFKLAEKDKKKDDKYQFLFETGPFEGYVAPDFTLSDLNGNPTSLSQFKGKIVFLNVWATWCGPCKTEMPSMEKLYQKFKKEDFVMLAISIDRQGKSVVIPFLEEMGLTFPVLLDPNGSIQKLYKIRALPSSLIIDKMGFVDTREAGARDWSSSSMIKLFEELINEETLDQSGTIKIKD